MNTFNVVPLIVQRALRDNQPTIVFDWLIDQSNLTLAYGMWKKPMDAIEALTRALKKVIPEKRAPYRWYRGLLYIQAQLPALAEQDFTAVIATYAEHRHTSMLARAYARVLLGDVRGALEDNDRLPEGTVLILDRVITPQWIGNSCNAAWERNAHRHASAA